MKIGVVFDLIWDWFNMLQIVANIRNLIASDRPIHGNFVVPSCITIFIDSLNTIVYFKPFEHDLIKNLFQSFDQYKKDVEFVR